MTGKPFWDVLLYENPPLWQAYINVCDRYGTEAWAMTGAVPYAMASPVTYRHTTEQQGERLIRHTVIETPDGVLTTTDTFFEMTPPPKQKK